MLPVLDAGGNLDITVVPDNVLRNDQVDTLTKQIGYGTVTLTDEASIVWNLEDAQVASVTLTANRALANPTNMIDGFTYILRVSQDANRYPHTYIWRCFIVSQMVRHLYFQPEPTR